MAALELWRSADPAMWLENLDAYPERIRALKKDGLEQLDRSVIASPCCRRCVAAM